MFGYVNANQEDLKICEYNRYRGFYCGLCQSLKDNYGIRSRLSLSYDITFLVMLLTSLYEPEVKERYIRCPFHPVTKHLELRSSFSDYGADMNVLCAWYTSEDKILDASDAGEKLEGAGIYALYRSAFKNLKLKYPGKVSRIEEYLDQLHQLESENCTDIDKVSGLSGSIVSEVFTPRRDEWFTVLQSIGFYLGKFIYLMDAWEDIEQDIKKNRYNPLIPLYEKDKDSTIAFDEICRNYMTTVMADCASQFERLPLIEDVSILRNIIYSGIWTRYELILENRRQKSESQKKERN